MYVLNRYRSSKFDVRSIKISSLVASSISTLQSKPWVLHFIRIYKNVSNLIPSLVLFSFHLLFYYEQTQSSQHGLCRRVLTSIPISKLSCKTRHRPQFLLSVGYFILCPFDSTFYGCMRI